MNHAWIHVAQAQTLDVKVVPIRSGSMRTWDQRIILDVFSNNTVSVALSGYLFFGSAIAVSDKLVAVRSTRGITVVLGPATVTPCDVT